MHGVQSGQTSVILVLADFSVSELSVCLKFPVELVGQDSAELGFTYFKASCGEIPFSGASF